MKSAFSPFAKALRNDTIQAYGLLFLAVALIGVKGFGSGQGFVSSVVHSYIDETAAADTESIQPQLADVSDLANLNNQPTPTPTAISTVEESYIQASAPADTSYLDTFKPDQVIEYTVKGGDTIGTIASDFGVSINTIIWANNLKNPNVLGVGQILKIPPVTGVIHTVQSGDTITSIAKKYSADASKILTFNDVTADQVLHIGDELMVPDGQMPGPKPVVKSTVASGGSSLYVPVGDGQCVAFVQAHGFAGLHGDAYQWAKYINTSAPRVGDAVVLKGGKYGHVAIITAVKADSIQIVEQNYYGPYIIDHREISLSSQSIVGFIQ